MEITAEKEILIKYDIKSSKSNIEVDFFENMYVLLNFHKQWRTYPFKKEILPNNYVKMVMNYVLTTKHTSIMGNALCILVQ